MIECFAAKKKGGETLMYHIAICDDSKEFISYIKGVLQEAIGDKNIELKIYEFMSGEELVRNLDRGINYDLLILDMQLGRMDGDETAQIFRKKFPFAVLAFCSGVRLPTIKSFKATPFRYLLKQQTRQELIETMKEILDEVEKNLNEPFIMAHYRWTTQMVKMKDILYIENTKRGGRIVVCPKCEEAKYEEKLLVDKKPEQLQAELEQFGFALAQSTYLVNMDHIELLHSEDFELDNGEVIKIARTYQKSFRDAFVKRFTNKYI
jgi:DNA-binding LytR/AlgR family response regulator